MDPFPFMLVLLLFLVVIVGSILGLIAFAATRRMESLLRTFPINELTLRIYQLEQKVAELQKHASSVATHTAAASPVSAPQAPPPLAELPKTQQPASSIPPPPTPTIHSREHSPQPVRVLPKPLKEPSASDLEQLIGGRWFNRIGIIALLFAVSYFLKLAFDNNWIGPAGRVAVGIFLGALLLPWSQWLLGRGYTYFSEGIAGLGEATLFVSVWAGCQYYTLFTRQTGFAALVLVTLVMAFLALRRDSERIAFLSLLGGLLTPAFVSNGKNEQVMLFSYLLCLGVAALVISWRKNWKSLVPLIFAGSHLYYWQWYDSFYSRALFLERTIYFASLFFLLYAVIPALHTFRSINLTTMDLLIVAANASAYSAALYTLLWPADRWPLALLFFLLAAGHLTVAAILPESGSSLPRFLYLGLAITFFTLAIPTQFDGNTITLAFALEGGALAWIGFRSHGALLRPAGYILLIIAALRLLLEPPSADTFLWNARFASYLVLIAGLLVPLCASASDSHLAPETAGAEAACLSVAANCFALIALSLEFWDYFGRGSGSSNHSLAQHLSISILCTCYAGVLIFFGLIRRSALLRWQAIILLGIIVAKVFLFDLSFLDRAYRILSFFILGSALLTISFLYQRKQARDHLRS